MLVNVMVFLLRQDFIRMISEQFEEMVDYRVYHI